MTSTGLRRKAVLLLLASTLTFPWAASAGPHLGSARNVEFPASAFLEDLLGRAWTFLTNDRNKTGCHIDPHGGCAPGESQPKIQTHTGCHLDPSGGCRD